MSNDEINFIIKRMKINNKVGGKARIWATESNSNIEINIVIPSNQLKNKGNVLKNKELIHRELTNHFNVLKGEK